MPGVPTEFYINLAKNPMIRIFLMETSNIENRFIVAIQNEFH